MTARLKVIFATLAFFLSVSPVVAPAIGKSILGPQDHAGQPILEKTGPSAIVYGSDDFFTIGKVALSDNLGIVPGSRISLGANVYCSCTSNEIQKCKDRNLDCCKKSTREGKSCGAAYCAKACAAN